MALETGTYISDLTVTNPTATDPRSEGDDHIRLLKTTIKNTFPNVNAAVTPTDEELNFVDGVTSALQGQLDAKASLAGANTFTGQQTFAEVKDTVYTITDGAAFEIDPANGSVQIVTLGASRTPAATNFEAGQTVLLGIDDGTAYAITWTTVAPVWVKAGGTAAAPTLAASGYTWILLTKIGSTIYAAEWGQP